MIFQQNKHTQFLKNYLPRETVPVHVMLRALVVVRAVVEVNLLKLVPVGQRTAGDVHVLFGVLFDTKHQRLAGIVQRAGDLERN